MKALETPEEYMAAFRELQTLFVVPRDTPEYARKRELLDAIAAYEAAHGFDKYDLSF